MNNTLNLPFSEWFQAGAVSCIVAVGGIPAVQRFISAKAHDLKETT